MGSSTNLMPANMTLNEDTEIEAKGLCFLLGFRESSTGLPSRGEPEMLLKHLQYFIASQFVNASPFRPVPMALLFLRQYGAGNTLWRFFDGLLGFPIDEARISGFIGQLLVLLLGKGLKSPSTLTGAMPYQYDIGQREVADKPHSSGYVEQKHEGSIALGFETGKLDTISTRLNSITSSGAPAAATHIDASQALAVAPSDSDLLCTVKEWMERRLAQDATSELPGNLTSPQCFQRVEHNGQRVVLRSTGDIWTLQHGSEKKQMLLVFAHDLEVLQPDDQAMAADTHMDVAAKPERMPDPNFKGSIDVLKISTSGSELSELSSADETTSESSADAEEDRDGKRILPLSSLKLVKRSHRPSQHPGTQRPVLGKKQKSETPALDPPVPVFPNLSRRASNAKSSKLGRGKRHNPEVDLFSFPGMKRQKRMKDSSDLPRDAKTPPRRLQSNLPLTPPSSGSKTKGAKPTVASAIIQFSFVDTTVGVALKAWELCSTPKAFFTEAASAATSLTRSRSPPTIDVLVADVEGRDSRLYFAWENKYGYYQLSNAIAKAAKRKEAKVEVKVFFLRKDDPDLNKLPPFKP